MANAIYKPVPLEVGNILKDVQSGKIGLPDLQRPFVWKNDKVRDLLDYSDAIGTPFQTIGTPFHAIGTPFQAIGTYPQDVV